tara:strand:+ start:1026 stop:1187 length:162 start_codon:yes stop_codon:yes gene_type:complete
MNFQYTPAQLTELSSLLQDAQNGTRPYSDVYKAAFFFISDFEPLVANWQSLTH